MKLAPWFPGTVKPVHIGVYERDYNPSNPRAYCYWDGTSWFTWRSTPKDAFTCRSAPSRWQNLPWRGVLK